MECREAQDQLLRADDPSPGGIASPELAEHVAHCGPCRQLAEELIQLEQAWRAIPLPAGADRARLAFLERLRKMHGPSGDMPAAGTRRGTQSRAPWRWLVAASVLIALGAGGSLLISTRRATASSDVVERLVEWNLDLTQAPSTADRGRIYAGQASTLRDAVRQARLPADERRLAESLLENAPWLAEHDDPLAEADRFNEVADALVDRMQAAATRGDGRRAARYARLYRQVAALGIEAKLEALERSGSLDFDRRRRLERIVLRDADRMRDLLALLERAPDSSRKEIRRSLGIVRKHPRKTSSAQATEPAGNDRRTRRSRARANRPD